MNPQLDFTPNSHRYKEEKKTVKTEPPKKKEVKKIISGPVKTKPRGEMRKFFDTLIADDISNAKSYIVTDVLIPTIKDTIWTIFTNSLDRILYPNGGGANRKKNNSLISNVSYNTLYAPSTKQTTNDTSSRTGYCPDNIVLTSRGDAEAVIQQMCDIIETYGSVSVADLYETIGKTGDYTDNKYGWKMVGERNPLIKADAVRVNGGYLLKLPKVLPLD